jgi:hypothetical protein
VEARLLAAVAAPRTTKNLPVDENHLISRYTASLPFLSFEIKSRWEEIDPVT